MSDADPPPIPSRCWQDVFLCGAHGIAVIDAASNRLLTCNPALEMMLGFTSRELIGQPVVRLFHPDDRAWGRHCIEEAHQRGRCRYEVRLLRQDGQGVPAQIDTACVADETGHQLYRIATVQDISDRFQTQQRLAEREAQYRSILDSASDAIVTANEQGVIVQVNAATQAMLGYAEAEMLGQNLQMLMPPPFRQEHPAYLHRYLATGERKIIGIGREVVVQRKDGSTLPVDLIVSEFHDGQRYFTGILRDITERKRLQSEILRIAEEEHRRIGEELHDDVQQQLTGLLLLARQLAKDVPRTQQEPEFSRELLTRVDRLIQGLKETAQSVRSLSHRLMPTTLLGRGLRDSLAHLVTDLNARQPVACRLEWNSACDISDPFVAMHLYRITQEAITNALKHSQASRIDVTCSLADGMLQLCINDNGIGMSSRRTGNGRGISIMSYRAGLIGAILTVTPGGDAGTQVQCTVPLKSVQNIGDNSPRSLPAVS